MTKTDNNDDEEFFGAIEKRFNQLRGTPLIISPSDWSLLAQWKKRGIPAIVIIEALEKGFERTSAPESRRRPINSLAYFRQIVEDCWESFQSLEVGKGKSSSAEGENEKEKILFHLESLRERFESLTERHSARKDIAMLLRKCASDLNELLSAPPGGEYSIEIIEEGLSAIERELHGSLMNAFETDEVERAKQDSEDELAHMKEILNEEQYREMIRKSTINKLRKIYGIPRLSLFFS